MKFYRGSAAAARSLCGRGPVLRRSLLPGRGSRAWPPGKWRPPGGGTWWGRSGDVPMCVPPVVAEVGMLGRAHAMPLPLLSGAGATTVLPGEARLCLTRAKPQVEPGVSEWGLQTRRSGRGLRGSCREFRGTLRGFSGFAFVLRGGGRSVCWGACRAFSSRVVVMRSGAVVVFGGRQLRWGLSAQMSSGSFVQYCQLPNPWKGPAIGNISG